MDEETANQVDSLMYNIDRAWERYRNGTYAWTATEAEHLDGVRTLLVDAASKIEGAL